jgi:hypothetical protein
LRLRHGPSCCGIYNSANEESKFTVVPKIAKMECEMKVSLTEFDASVPRTIYYERFIDALRRNPRFINSEADADVLFPAEDTAFELNWPRYGNPSSAIIRGAIDPKAHQEYLGRFLNSDRPLCIVNMNPFARVPQIFCEKSNVVVADISLAAWERAIDPRTISMPALPIVVGGVRGPANKSVLASFRGAASHPCRDRIAALHDGETYICQLVDPKNHSGRLDAIAAVADSEYQDLLTRSAFAFVPRGDALFSYRLLEALSFACVPIVQSDGWILPFDRSVDWSTTALLVPESATGTIPEMLEVFSDHRIAQMIEHVAEVYRRCFASFDEIVETLLRELEQLIG